MEERTGRVSHRRESINKTSGARFLSIPDRFNTDNTMGVEDEAAAASQELSECCKNKKAAKLLGIESTCDKSLDSSNTSSNSHKSDLRSNNVNKAAANNINTNKVERAGSSSSAPSATRNGSSNTFPHVPAPRRVSFQHINNADKAARLLGMGSTIGVGGVGLPTTSETSECGSIYSTGSIGGNAATRKARFSRSHHTTSFGSNDTDSSALVSFEDSVGESAPGNLRKGKKKGRLKPMGKAAKSLISSMRRRTTVEVGSAIADSSPSDNHHGIGGKIQRNFSKKWNPSVESVQSQPTKSIGVSWGSGVDREFFDEDDEFPGEREEPMQEHRKSMTSRRENLDAKSLTMGLDMESANFLDWMTQAKCQEWLKSLSRRDPRANIKSFFDDLARDGADNIEEENGFQPELLSPLLSMFQRSSVFSVWRPTSVDSIHKMMTGQGTGKGLDIKGKSAKKGKLSAYVPFLQIHEDEHKTKIRLLPSDGHIRIFYKKREARDNAQNSLSELLDDMTKAADLALKGLLESDKVCKEDFAQDEMNYAYVQRVLSSFRSVDSKGTITDEEQEKINILDEWSMENPAIEVIDDYVPKCYGLDIPKRLFWEGYVMRAKDITRPPGSVYDTGRPSRASFQDMNFASIKNECEEDMPRAVVWQYTDPYLPPTEPDPDPMMPQTLLMAYEEHGRVMPVVSDFDCFLLGTRGVRFHTPLPEDQVELLHDVLGEIDNILKENEEGKSNNWTASWLNTMKHQKKHITMPKYGFGDPKSYAIMKYAVQRLEEFGAVRHGAECFNFYFPQELDDEFLVIGGNLGGAKYKYMKLTELQDFLSGCIDLGFTFPLNPKWVLCDEGWKALWDKLTGSTHPNVQLSINAWYPPGSGLKERIEEIRQHHPDGFQSDLSGRKKGTQAWDEAEIALDRYQRIQRAKRKLRAVLTWISIVQQSRKKVLLAREQEEAAEGEAAEGEVIEVDEKEVEVQVTPKDSDEQEEGEVVVVEGDEVGEDEAEVNLHSEKRVSFQNIGQSSRATSSPTMNDSDDLVSPTTLDEIATLECNTKSHVRAQTDGDIISINARSHSFTRQSSSELSEGDDENIKVIDAVLLRCKANLSEYEITGLRRIRKQLFEQSSSSQLRVNHRFERRHTSADSKMTAKMLEDAPSFILKEYGGVKGEAKISFKAQVKKIMHAQRWMATARKVSELAQSNESNFLPVEWTSMSTESKQILMEKLSFAALQRWDYNILEVAKICNGSPLLFIGWAILGSPHAQQAMAIDLGTECNDTNGYSFVTELNVQMPILCSFLRTVEADYLLNPYHNNTHAADVVQTLNTMLQLGGKNFASSPLDIFSILVAAVIHDVKHPGLNNNFQINSRSALAVQYNDVSVLENYSITWLFSKLLGQTRDFTVDIFSGLSNEQFSKARSIIVRSVLETDMTHHFDLLKKMGIHQEMLKNKGAVGWLQTYTNEGVNYDPSMDMLCFLLHQADISNPAKPFPLFVEWADSILAESYAQGDKEAALSLPVSPLCDRVATDKKQSQIGFIKFVVRPSYRLLGEVIPLFAETVFPHIETSLEFWDKYEEGIDTC